MKQTILAEGPDGAKEEGRLLGAVLQMRSASMREDGTLGKEIYDLHEKRLKSDLEPSIGDKVVNWKKIAGMIAFPGRDNSRQLEETVWTLFKAGILLARSTFTGAGYLVFEEGTFGKRQSVIENTRYFHDELLFASPKDARAFCYWYRLRSGHRTDMRKLTDEGVELGAPTSEGEDWTGPAEEEGT